MIKLHRSFYRYLNTCIKRSGIRITRGMASDTKQDHLERTADNTRENVVSKATVIEMRSESETVKGLTLQIHNKLLSFKAGQWVDLFIPELNKVGGYSMSSSPLQLKEKNTLDLAVKYSTHPPAHWVHTKCSVGTEVQVRVGGDVFYEATTDNQDQNLLLIAGGIGINPMYSILRHVTDKQPKGSDRKVFLLYSASSTGELIFQDSIKHIQGENKENVKCKYFVTQDKSSEIDSNTTHGRISSEDVMAAVQYVQSDNFLTFICGPGQMITDMEDLLIQNNVNKNKIMYEKWW